MIRIVKFIFISLSWYFGFKEVRKYDYKEFLESLNTYLRSLSPWNLFQILRDLITDSLTDNFILRGFTIPLNLDLKNFTDTRTKKWYLFVFMFSIVANRWMYLLKKIILLPFKLGIFSFLYSILGFDVMWFLSLFNFFPINIPYWVYFQYLLLYNNWLNWWYNAVNIKSIKSVNSGESYAT